MGRTYLMTKLKGTPGQYAVFDENGDIQSVQLAAGLRPKIHIIADEDLTNVTVNGAPASGGRRSWYFDCDQYGDYRVLGTQNGQQYSVIVEVKVVKQYTIKLGE